MRCDVKIEVLGGRGGKRGREIALCFGSEKTKDKSEKIIEELQ